MNETLQSRMQAFVKENTKLIATLLEQEIDQNDYLNLENKLLALAQISGTAAKCQAYSKQLLNFKELEIIRTLSKELSPSMAIKQLNAECWEQAGQYEYCQRLSASISHSIDSIRTVLSFAKSDMANSKQQI